MAILTIFGQLHFKLKINYKRLRENIAELFQISLKKAVIFHLCQVEYYSLVEKRTRNRQFFFWQKLMGKTRENYGNFNIDIPNYIFYILVRHRKDPSQFSCDLCGKHLKSEDSLKKHVQFTCLQDRPEACPICGKNFIVSTTN